MAKPNENLAQRAFGARERVRDAGQETTEAESRARTAASSFPAALAAFDRDLNITFVNDAARELLGLDHGASLRGHPALSLVTALADAADDVLQRGSTRTLAAAPPWAQVKGCAPGACLSVVVAPLRRRDGTICDGTIVATAGNCPLLAAARSRRNDNG